MDDSNGQEAFSKRLKELADDAGSTNALAVRSGVSQSGIRKYFLGGEPSRSNLVSLANAAGVRVEWLATGQGPKYSKDIREGQLRELGSAGGSLLEEEPNRYGAPVADLVFIPVYSVSASAGGGTSVENEQIEDELAFKNEWIRNRFRASPTDLCLIHVNGESMEPTLSDGDLVLVDRREQGSGGDGLYVVRIDDSLLVKRIQHLPAGRFLVKSDNPTYSSFEVGIENGQTFSIIGRVVWLARTV